VTPSISATTLDSSSPDSQTQTDWLIASCICDAPQIQVCHIQNSDQIAHKKISQAFLVDKNACLQCDDDDDDDDDDVPERWKLWFPNAFSEVKHEIHCQESHISLVAKVPTQETWQDDIRQAHSRSNHRQRKDKPHTPHCCSSMVERIGKVGHCTSLVWRSTVTSKMSTGKQQQGKEGTSKGLISLSPIMVLQFPKHGGDHCSHSFSSQN